MVVVRFFVGLCFSVCFLVIGLLSFVVPIVGVFVLPVCLICAVGMPYWLTAKSKNKEYCYYELGDGTKQEIIKDNGISYAVETPHTKMKGDKSSLDIQYEEKNETTEKKFRLLFRK